MEFKISASKITLLKNKIKPEKIEKKLILWDENLSVQYKYIFLTRPYKHLPFFERQASPQEIQTALALLILIYFPKKGNVSSLHSCVQYFISKITYKYVVSVKKDTQRLALY